MIIHLYFFVVWSGSHSRAAPLSSGCAACVGPREGNRGSFVIAATLADQKGRLRGHGSSVHA